MHPGQRSIQTIPQLECLDAFIALDHTIQLMHACIDELVMVSVGLEGPTSVLTGRRP